jgi:hypothetical protein
MTTTLDTTNWVSYPFTVNGIKFNSLVDPLSSMQDKISKVPPEVFKLMNTAAILSVLGNPEALTILELKTKLDEVNKDASVALLELVGE